MVSDVVECHYRNVRSCFIASSLHNLLSLAKINIEKDLLHIIF